MKKTRIPGWAVIFAVTLLLAACASHDARMADINIMSGPDATLAQLDDQTQTNPVLQLERRENAAAMREAWLDEREKQLDQEKTQLENRENAVAIGQAWIEEREVQLQRATGSTQIAGSGGLLPVNAKRGSCYAKIFVPAEYLTVTEKVLKKEAGERVEIIPARYETVSEQVLVEKGSLQLQVIPAEYGYKEERVMVEPAKKKLVQIPAQYEQINEQVLVKPGETVWKKGTNPLQQVDAATGEILCLVDAPAKYQTVSKSILKSPASVREVEVPPVYKTVQRRVVVTPATTRMVDVPPKYKTVQVTKMVEPEQVKSVPIPAQYQTVTKQVKVTDPHIEWQEILCETNMTHSRVSDLQRALLRAGFNPGPIDGVIGPQTMAAINAFQKERSLAVAKYLTMDTVQALETSL